MYQHLIYQLQLNNILTNERRLAWKAETRLLTNSEMAAAVTTATSFLLYSACLKTRLHCILQGVTEQPRCNACNCVVRMRMSGRYRFTFPRFCSSKCSGDDNSVKSKRHNTMSNKSDQQLSDIKLKRKSTRDAQSFEIKTKNNDKRTQTLIEKYGSIEKYYDYIKQKRINTNLERYGVANAFQNPEVKEKQINTIMLRYGVTNVFEHQDIQNKAKQAREQLYGDSIPLRVPSIREKFTNTMKEKYGNAHYWSSHISDEAFNILNDKEAMSELINNDKLSGMELALRLDVVPSTVYKYAKQHSIDLTTDLQNNFVVRDIKTFIDSLQLSYIENDRTIISPKELDIVIEDKQIALEINGVYWHSELNGKDSSYHIGKTNQAKEHGYRLIHIYDKEWYQQRNIVKSRLSTIFGKPSEKIFARNCSVIKIDNQTANNFFTETHIQGATPSASHNYALMHGGQIVQVATFGKSRYNKKVQWELLRLSSKLFCSVVGGASKLFAHFVREHSPQSIVSYSDKRWNTGNVYKRLGFTYSHCSTPNYYYFKQSKTGNINFELHSRVSFQKHKLKDKLEMFDPNLTEWQNMQLNGYDRIWDCGNDVWIWKPNII